ncbi:MAG: phosphate ABC transporter permease subunit PstC [Pseudanabaenaceae cyanobacterium bins.68]|nr:phosphate ABC transporter permease subunit PstC [Pseudanabaenaceae cyanobacterium bins.68]
MTTDSSVSRSRPTFRQVKAAREPIERVIEVLLFLAAASSVLTTFGIMYVLIGDTIDFFKEVPLADFFNISDPKWTPLFEDKHFAILTLIAPTLVTTGVSVIFAVPIGTIIAIYLSEYAAGGLREWLKPILEILAGIPSVVFGYFALLVVTPLLQKIYPDLGGFNMLSAGLVMGISIVPLITSIAEDAMRAVPVQMREGAYAVGATRIQTALQVVIPSAISGIIAGYILGISRSIGQTMIVGIAAGLQTTYTWNPLDGAATISAYIMQVSQGDIANGTLEYNTIFAAGLTLVLLTLVLNLLGYWLIRKYREVY